MKDIQINYDKTFATKYSKDYYRGKSFHYCGNWAPGVHYANDDDHQDFVVYESMLLVCSRSHTSSINNKPTPIIDPETQEVIGIDSSYWDLVFSAVVAQNLNIDYRITNEFGDNPKLIISQKGYTTGIRNVDSKIDSTKEELSDTITEHYQELVWGDETLRSLISETESDLRGNINSKYSELSQTIDEVSSIVAANKTELDGTIASNYTTLTQRADSIEAKAARDLGDAVGELNAAITLTADGITSVVNANKQELDNTIANHYSEFQQTANEISSTVAANKTATDGQYESLNSKIDQTAENITSTVEAYKEYLDGEISDNYSELSQRADQISSTVTANKAIADGQYSTLNSRITQTAADITSTVEAYKAELDGTISDNYSELKQTADSISSTVVANKNAADDAISTLQSDITQTASVITSRVAAVENDITTKYSQITQTTDAISSTVAANKADADSNFSNIRSNITQTATQIRSEVSDIKEELDDDIADVSSQITQTAESISSEVNQKISNATSSITTAYNSAITQKANEITSSVKETTDALGERLTSAESSITQNANNISLEVSARQASENSIASKFAQHDELLESLQGQIDGAIDMYFHEGVPTLSNFPANEWTTVDLKNTHLGDLYYNKNTGLAYRFVLDNTTYKWTQIEDDAIAKALADAAKAQATADGKMTIFYSQPSTYRVGDMWIIENSDNECIIKKSNYDRDNNYVESDWYLISDLANVTKVRAAFAILADMIASEVGEYDSNNNLVPGTLYSKILQSRDKISLKIGQAKSEAIADAEGKVNSLGQDILDTGIDITNKKIELTADNIILKNNSGTRALSIVDGSDGKPVIDTSNLNVSGIFTTSSWNNQKTSILNNAASDATNKANAAKSDAAADATTKANTAQDNAIIAAAADALSKANAAESNAKSYADELDSAVRTYVNSYDYFSTKILPDVQTAINTKAQDLIDNQISSANDAALAAQILANAAQTTANTAVTDAATADAKAVAAQQAADDANALLDDWASDSVISPTEKRALAQQLNDINQEKVSILADADKYGLAASDKTAYTTAYNKAKIALEYYSNVNSDPENITIITNTSDNRCYANIAAYYIARTTILNLIATAAKKVATDAQAAADAAQEAANTANQAAATADAKAVQAQADATAANAQLTDWASDGKISPVEKTALYQQYLDIKQEKVEIDADIERYNISATDKTTFNNAYNAAITAFEKYFPPAAEMNATTAKASDYNNIGAYYNARATILGIIAGKIKSEIHLIDYLKDALHEDTTISNGLILTTLIQLGSSNQGSWQVYSGINGSYQGPTSIAAWYGGQMKDKELAAYTNDSTAAKSLFRMDGSGYLANKNISWDTSGNASFTGAITATSIVLSGTTLPSSSISGLGSLATKNKVDASNDINGLSTVATSGKYSDLTGKPSIPDTSNLADRDTFAQKLGYTDYADMVAKAAAGSTIIDGGHIRTSLIETSAITIGSGQVTGLGKLAKKDSVSASTDVTGLATVATTGSYNSLSNKPTIPDVSNLANRDTFAQQLGYNDYDDLVNAAASGNTLIYNGLIRTNLIDADAINVKAANITGKLSASQIKVSEISIGSSQVSDLGTLATKDNVGASNLDNTIIEGGYIKTGLINASAITISNSQVTGLGNLATQNSIGLSNLDNTIISGGYIKTGLINASAITIGASQISDLGTLATKDSVSATNGEITGLAAVATTGSYNSLSNKPTIPDVSNLADRDIFAQKLGYTNYNALVTAASNGQTLIYNGLIRTNLIDADALTVNAANINGTLTASQIDASGIIIDASQVENLPPGTDLTGYAKIEDLPTNITDLIGGTNVLHSTDVTVAQSSTANGLTKRTITVGDKSFTEIEAGDFVLTNIGKGTDSAGNNYTMISNTGLLKARNAIIYGTIYASAGQIGGLTLQDNALTSTNFNLSSNGTLTATNATISGAITATSLTLSGATIPSSSVTGLGSLATKSTVSATTDVVGLGSLATKDKVAASTDITGLSTVATSGKYSDLSGQPSIPDISNCVTTTQLSNTLSSYTTNTSLSNTLSNYLTTSAAASTYLVASDLNGYVKTNVGIGTDATDSTYFLVSTNGLLTAKNAVITGQINATSGYIGGIVIGNNGIASDNNKFSVDSNGNVYASSITLANGVIGGSTGNFSFGSTTANNNTISWIKCGMTSLSDTTNNGIYLGTDGIALGKGVFKVTSAGAVTASNISVTGGSISIKNGSDTLFSASSSGVSVKGAITATSLTLGSDVKIPYSSVNNTPDLNIYIAKGDPIGDGTFDDDGEEVSAFEVSNNGLLQAKNAVIYGTIFASEGRIGGLTLSNNALSSTNFSLSSTGVLNATGATISGDITATNLTIANNASIQGLVVRELETNDNSSQNLKNIIIKNNEIEAYNTNGIKCTYIHGDTIDLSSLFEDSRITIPGGTFTSSYNGTGTASVSPSYREASTYFTVGSEDIVRLPLLSTLYECIVRFSPYETESSDVNVAFTLTLTLWAVPSNISSSNITTSNSKRLCICSSNFNETGTRGSTTTYNKTLSGVSLDIPGSQFTSGTNYRLVLTSAISFTSGGRSTINISLNFPSDSIVLKKKKSSISSLTELGANGLQVVESTTQYVLLGHTLTDVERYANTSASTPISGTESDGVFECRKGNYGIRIDSTGVYKFMKNALGERWVAVSW